MTRNRKSGAEPLAEPGKRSGEGSESIVPHMQRQVQGQVKPDLKRPTPQDQEDQQDEAA